MIPTVSPWGNRNVIPHNAAIPLHGYDILASKIPSRVVVDLSNLCMFHRLIPWRRSDHCQITILYGTGNSYHRCYTH